MPVAASLLISALLALSVMAAPAMPTSAGTGEPSGEPLLRRIAGDDRAGTAAAVAADGWQDASTVVIADGRDQAVSLVGAHLAARMGAPVLLGGPGVPVATAAALDRLQPELVVVVGDVDQGAVDDAAGTAEVRRLPAAAPSDMAAAAVRWASGPADAPVVLVASGASVDALAAANLAPARLLMTAPDQLDASTAQLLDDLDPDEVVLVGGVAALSPEVESTVRDLGPATRRVAGDTRYGTSTVASSAGSSSAGATASGGTIVVASGERFADAVSFVPWVAAQRSTGRPAGLVLTPHDELPGVVLDHLGVEPFDHGVIAGGPVAVGTWVDRQLMAVLSGAPEPPAVRAVRVLTPEEREAMTGPAWRPGCPVGLDDLRAIDLTRWLPSGDVADDGILVVHADVAADVATVVQRLFDARFPLERVRPIEEFGGDDDASMAANNSSAFNCRTVAGTSTWSQHAHGRAIDLNPVQNPYVRGSDVQPEAGRGYLDRTHVRPGMIVPSDPVVDAFAAVGWGWGGDFSSSRDYQHFSATGR